MKTELVRGSKSAQTIDDQKTSTMIRYLLLNIYIDTFVYIYIHVHISTCLHLHLRDRYINELAYYNKIGVGRTPAKFEESFFEFKTEKFL